MSDGLVWPKVDVGRWNQKSFIIEGNFENLDVSCESDELIQELNIVKELKAKKNNLKLDGRLN